MGNKILSRTYLFTFVSESMDDSQIVHWYVPVTVLDALNIHFLVIITTLYLTTDLNARVKIINLLEENTGKRLQGLKLGNWFLRSDTKT